MKTRIHVTDRQTFKECRRKWYWDVNQHLKPIGDAGAGGPLWIGSSVHDVLAQYYRGRMMGTPLSLLSVPEMHDRWCNYEGADKVDGETRDMCLHLLEGYRNFSETADAGWRVQTVETEIELKIPGTRVYLVGTIDLTVQYNNRLWIVDHKTAAQLPDERALELDDQMTAYQWLALNGMGIKAAGAIYNVLRKKIPTQPKVLKAGGLSKDRSIDTTYDVYYQAVLENNLDPVDYVDMLDMLKNKPNTFFWRSIIARNRLELDKFGEYLTAEARDMTSKKTVLYPSPSRNCTYCDYRVLCKCENEGGDVDYLKKSFYVEVEGRK